MGKFLVKLFKNKDEHMLIHSLSLPLYQEIISYTIDTNLYQSVIKQYVVNMFNDAYPGAMDSEQFESKDLIDFENNLIKKYTTQYCFTIVYDGDKYKRDNMKEIGYVRYSMSNPAQRYECSPYKLFECNEFNADCSGDGSSFQITYNHFVKVLDKIETMNIKCCNYCVGDDNNEHVNCNKCHGLKFIPVLKEIFKENELSEICILFS
eukprot:487892_1